MSKKRSLLTAAAHLTVMVIFLIGGTASLVVNGNDPAGVVLPTVAKFAFLIAGYFAAAGIWFIHRRSPDAATTRRDIVRPIMLGAGVLLGFCSGLLPLVVLLPAAFVLAAVGAWIATSRF